VDRRKIAEMVTPDELREIIQALVRTPSLNPPGDVKDCADVLASFFEKEGIPVRQLAVTDKLVNVVATLDGRSAGKTMWYNGHIDVVPAGADWTRDPWGGEYVDGRIYGRGATDMKGGLTSLMGSMIALKRAGCPFNGKIVFSAAADEETGSDSGTVWLIQNKVVTADYAIIAEPTKGWVEIGHRGTLWVEATIKGKANHACQPHLGVNAVHYAAKAITALTSLEFPTRLDLFEVPTGGISVTMINGGTKLNIVPDRCTLGIDRRMLPVDNVEEATEQIRQTIASVMAEGAGFDLRVIKAWPPVMMEEGHILVRTMIKAFKELQGYQPPIRAKAGATDASFVKGMAGIPFVLYGPGPSAICHMADEYVELDEIVKAAHMYTLTSLDLLA
jgi:succinyl-diaminopimelate desuccinylase